MLRALHIAIKDCNVWLRDVAAMGILLGMPVVLIFILGAALGGGGSDSQIAVAIVNLDQGVTAPMPGEPLTSSRGFQQRFGAEITESLQDNERLAGLFAIEVAENEADVLARVAEGDLAAALVIPADFSRSIQSGAPVELEVLKDPGAELASGIWESVVSATAAQYAAASVVVQTVMREVPATPAPGPPIATEERVAQLQRLAVAAATGQDGVDAIEVVITSSAPDVELGALDFFGVSMTAMFLMFGAMFGAFATIRERREKTLDRLLATPTSGMAITAGKMLGIFVLGMLQFTVLYLFTSLAFGVRWGADLVAIFAIAAAEVIAVTGLAVLIASLTRTERGAGGLGPLIIQIQALIGGAFFTIAILPEWLQPVRYASIIGWAMEGWQTVQLRGGGLGDVLGPIAALLGFALAFFAFGAYMMGRRS